MTDGKAVVDIGWSYKPRGGSTLFVLSPYGWTRYLKLDADNVLIQHAK